MEEGKYLNSKFLKYKLLLSKNLSHNKSGKANLFGKKALSISNHLLNIKNNHPRNNSEFKPKSESLLPLISENCKTCKQFLNKTKTTISKTTLRKRKLIKNINVNKNNNKGQCKDYRDLTSKISSKSLYNDSSFPSPVDSNRISSLRGTIVSSRSFGHYCTATNRKMKRLLNIEIQWNFLHVLIIDHICF